MKQRKTKRDGDTMKPVVGPDRDRTPIADRLREWVVNPCHGRIAAPFEFASLVDEVAALERSNKIVSGSETR